jgi:hypothetical protein
MMKNCFSANLTQKVEAISSNSLHLLCQPSFVPLVRKDIDVNEQERLSKFTLSFWNANHSKGTALLLLF